LFFIYSIEFQYEHIYEQYKKLNLPTYQQNKQLLKRYIQIDYIIIQLIVDYIEQNITNDNIKIKQGKQMYIYIEP
jgi:hypothetical protein